MGQSAETVRQWICGMRRKKAVPSVEEPAEIYLSQTSQEAILEYEEDSSYK